MPKTSIAVAQAQLNAAIALYAGATLSIYSGAYPGSPSVALNPQQNVLLALFTFATPAFPTPASATAPSTSTGIFIQSTVPAAVNGLAVFARATSSDGVTVLQDFTVGPIGADINLTTVDLTAGGAVTINQLTLAQPAN